MEAFGHKVRRVVTGHDGDGKSVIVLDDEPIATALGNGETSRMLTAVWATIAKGASHTSFEVRDNRLGPNATEIRVVDMPPGSLREMHQTDTIDYGIVLAGEIHLILERGETLLRCGDFVIQRGTVHSWHNRSVDVARLIFVNISGHITDHERSPNI